MFRWISIQCKDKSSTGSITYNLIPNINPLEYIFMFTIQNFNLNQQPRRSQRRTGEEVYFEGAKNNEITDMKNFLKKIVSDPEKSLSRKQIVHKITAYTTQGYDTSKIYPEMVLASATKDIVQKKLIYLFLSTYSSTNDNYARMAINTYLKDTYSPNPNVRGFALRNLSNLRFKGREQYVVPVLTKALDDFSLHVRKNAIMGLAKVIVQRNRGRENPQRDQQLLNRFYGMIRDTDSGLVCTVMQAINQIEEQGIVMSKKLANYLLINIDMFAYSQLPSVLSYLQMYQPKTKQQVINTLTVLEPKMKSSSASVVLAVSKIYLKMSKIHPQLSASIHKVIKSSLLSLLRTQVPQVQYVVLKHIQLIITQFGPQGWSNSFKQFLIYGSQPTYNKVVMVAILQKLINKTNHSDIINQFVEYLLDEDISRQTAAMLNRHLLKATQNQAKFILKNIIRVVDVTPKDFLCNNVMPLLRNYLRIYPNDFPLLTNIFYPLVQNIKEDAAKCAIVEIIGDFGQMIEDAVELLAWNHNEISDGLKVSLLRASVKLFLKRPHQMHSVLSSLFKNILNDQATHLHVKDYASYLYRALSSNIQEFKAMFLQKRSQTFAGQPKQQTLQFNTLEVMYGQQQTKWIIEKTKYIQLQQQDLVQYEGQPQQSLQAQVRQVQINLDSKFKRLQCEDFDVTFSMKPQQFQQKWQDYDIGSSITRIVQNVQLLSDQNLQQLFKIWNIAVLASVDAQDQIRLYSYCRVQSVQGDLGVACMQFTVQKVLSTLTLMIKCEDEELAGFISRYVQEFLKINQII